MLGQSVPSVGSSRWLERRVLAEEHVMHHNLAALGN